MDRRQMMTTTALGMGGFVIGTGFAAPACGPSKEKAVKYVGLVIELAKESTPLLSLLGQQDLATLIDTKAVPALEKLKTALANADIPASQSALATVRSVLSGIQKALSNLPESPRLITIMGIMASVNVLLMTVEAFVESETPVATNAGDKMMAAKLNTNAEAIRRVYEVSRP